MNAVGDYKVSKFLRHFWISKFEVVRKEQVYKKLRDHITPDNVREFVEELANEAIIYSNLQLPSHEFWNNTEIENLLEELNILKVEQVYVLLLAAFQNFYEGGEREKFKSLLRKIISFTFRWSTICGLNPNELERLYSNLAIKLRRNEINFEDLIEELRKRTPTNEEFLEKFEEKEIKNNRLAKYILLRLNNFLLKKAGKKEITVDIRRVNLEHIIPKKPDREWINFFQEKGIKKWDEFIHKIGNLTILLREYNRKIANKFFTRKKEMYEKSILPLNEKLKTYTEFGPSQISERVREMGKIAKIIWKV